MKVIALVPAHNEQDRIANTVGAILGVASIASCIVIDDGSRDDTAQIAEEAGARVIRLVNNVGKGAALEVAAKRCEDADIIVLLDGDLGISAQQADLLVASILKGEADMSIARFPTPAGKAGFGLVKNMARRQIAAMGNGFDAQAPLSGQRAMTRACLDAIRPFSSGYGVEVGLTIRALRKGYRLTEVETTMSHAATGRDVSGFIHRGKQFVHIGLALVKLRFEK
ncbi:MAG: glycosyltransferase family 2 protein [Coriobacteriia bacterium]|nr:glycosyltransferase family 2 protein [Coriobacteriia bacterium]